MTAKIAKIYLSLSIAGSGQDVGLRKVHTCAFSRLFYIYLRDGYFDVILSSVV